MKYFEVSIHIGARTHAEAMRLLKQFVIDTDNVDDMWDCSMHCTEHDPTIPYVQVCSHDEDDNNMHDCTNGCKADKA